ncbi:aspartate carbamoyltransferase regulatory subunit [uncultured Ilyobacter sp.]|uniref:aspartate carbamoyltransferase regulatory subunit n=1 Tax=uncultured Ilyobacter sp. TaxID=544433 RepID=UPI0029C7C8F2|nr:aspartate carbamoyltransferase regulatory subunit [uncultured Ilyobacter sp.]
MELQINAIENGTVIDHIDSEKTLEIMNLLELNKEHGTIMVAFNLESSKQGKKGIIKIDGRILKDEEIEKIAILAPKASINIIKDFKVLEKKMVKLPGVINDVIKCQNPKCVTNFEKVSTKFFREEEKYRCAYCEASVKKNNIILK